jgi:hypothetical protein
VAVGYGCAAPAITRIRRDGEGGRRTETHGNGVLQVDGEEVAGIRGDGGVMKVVIGVNCKLARGCLGRCRRQQEGKKR